MITQMHRRRLLTTLTLLMLISPLLLGCGGSGGNGPQKSADDYVVDGWAKYTAGDHSGALADFRSSIGKDSRYAPAFLGAGWTHLHLMSADTAILLLGSGLLMNTDSLVALDFYAAIALTHFQNEVYNVCIRWADSCLAQSAMYVFVRDSTIDHLDLKIAKAISYFQLGGDANLVTAAALVHDLDSSIDLDPEDPDSWWVGSVQYTTFSEALLRALEKVSKAVGQ